jgi:hypothetical protein
MKELGDRRKRLLSSGWERGGMTVPAVGMKKIAGQRPPSQGTTMGERNNSLSAEAQRLFEDARRQKNWKRWGPYLSERQWGTVREDYSADGTCWEYLPHDHARSRAYRWGEDGLLGFTDRECRLCFAVALWNGRDPILKERLFGLAGAEGNHGEDVKECYFYLDATPTYSYVKALYKYPQAEFPYTRLLEENRRRSRDHLEFELTDTGVFNEQKYFDIYAEYAKASPDDILIRLTVANRGPEKAVLHLLPTLWFRNTWAWGCTHEGCSLKPRIVLDQDGSLLARHETLGQFRLSFAPSPDGPPPEFLFTDNETNTARLFGSPNPSPHVKDAFHDYVVHNHSEALNRLNYGTKAAAWFRLAVPPGAQNVISLRLSPADSGPQPSGESFTQIFTERIQEAEAFYSVRIPHTLSTEEQRVVRQAYGGLLMSKQFYHFVVKDWLEGDPGQPTPPSIRKAGRNREWPHLFNRDIISVPDKWEYPWYAAWDHAFHMVSMARIDPEFAKEQLILFLREWYMHPNGQLPAYEFAFSDVNPPVHAWAAWRVYKMTGAHGERDRLFLSRVFQKLLLNFTWWVNRKDAGGNNLFQGGFLGLDNIGVFDRSKPLPTGGVLEQADGTAWMAFFCATMLSIALKLAQYDPVYEDMASKFFEHFVMIADAMNTLGGTGLWHEEDGFYYDQLHFDGRLIPLRIRSLVGLIPLMAAENLEDEVISQLPGFSKRMRWFLDNRPDLAAHITCMETGASGHAKTHRLLAIPSRPRLLRVLGYVLDEKEFLSPFGIRSLSRIHEQRPFTFEADHVKYTVGYEPGEAQSGLFGGNSNWRGPIWFPTNYLLIEALERYHHFYGESFQVECPTGSGRRMNLQQVADEIAGRLTRLFLPDSTGRRPCFGEDPRFAEDPHWRDLLLFHEYFHADTGRGLGASHQTGWTALVARCLECHGKSGR